MNCNLKDCYYIENKNIFSRWCNIMDVKNYFINIGFRYGYGNELIVFVFTLI